MNFLKEKVKGLKNCFLDLLELLFELFLEVAKRIDFRQIIDTICLQKLLFFGHQLSTGKHKGSFVLQLKKNECFFA